VLDDIEKDEARYSPGEVEKRLGTLIDAIFPLNERAKVVIVGTVTRPGSINHQLVKIATGQIEPGSEEWESVRWISDERIVPHYHPPIINLPDGSRRSCWPQKWPLEYLESIEHTRNYKKNFENNPRAGGGMYWSDEDIRYGVPPNVGVEYLFVDPPVTRGPKADKCGLSVLGYAPGHGGMPTVEQKRMLGDEWDTRMTREEAMEQGVTRLSRVCVMHAEEVSLTGAPLFQRVLELIALRPSIRAVVVETNQGGDLWKETFADLPAGVRLITFTSTIKKEIRIARSLDLYQKFRVTHARSFGVLEDAQTAYPKIEYDDLIDANSTGTLYLLKPRATRKNHTLRQR
jgi:hypothetical protein